MIQVFIIYIHYLYQLGGELIMTLIMMLLFIFMVIKKAFRKRKASNLLFINIISLAE